MLITEEYLLGFVPERFLQDERYRKGHIGILSPKEGTRILGMHTPEMKKVAKALSRSEDFREQLSVWKEHRPLGGADGLTHEERMIWGLAIDYAKVPLEERLSLVEEFVPCVDNWALCDNFCCNAAWVEKSDKKRVWEFIKGLIFSREEFTSRVGVILALAHYLDESNLERTIRTVEERAYADTDPYYIRMGAAWIIAEALCKGYDKTLPYLLEHRFPRWIHNKAIQKARESFRISDERKEYLRSLKY